MTLRIPERDWKVLRSLKDRAIDRHCKRILSEVAELAGDDGGDAHRRYLEVFRVIMDRNEEVAETFDALGRGNAIFKLCWMRRLGLLTDEEFSRFSDETRETIERFLSG